MSIRAESISKRFGIPPQQVLSDVSFEVRDGEFVALVGRSGSGKSTLLYILSTLDKATSGEVWISDKSTSEMSSREIHAFRNREMGYIFQFHYLLPELTALENVLMPARKTGLNDTLIERAEVLLATFGLGDKLHRNATRLSGGEQQRVAIARSLILQPKYLFADEPTGNLDSANGEMVMAILQKINREMGTTIVMVTHDPDFAALATRRISLIDGKISG